ncbi:MAG: hypothetical protein M1286_03365 [Candidatus Marsarchaeota archaeon]|nr:hypothetical protein [Candidatus Marsarchaeota archaeon]
MSLNATTTKGEDSARGTSTLHVRESRDTLVDKLCENLPVNVTKKGRETIASFLKDTGVIKLIDRLICMGDTKALIQLFDIAKMSRNVQLITNISNLSDALSEEGLGPLVYDIEDFLQENTKKGRTKQESVLHASHALEKVAEINARLQFSKDDATRRDMTLLVAGNMAMRINDNAADYAAGLVQNGGDHYGEIAVAFTYAARWGQREESIHRIAQLMSKAGYRLFMNYDFMPYLPIILSNKLDMIVEKENDLFAVYVYFLSHKTRIIEMGGGRSAKVLEKSNTTLPTPTKDNLKYYEALASASIRNEHPQICRKLTLDEVIGLATLNNNDLKQVVRMHAKSSEEHVQVYQMFFAGSSDEDITESVMKSTVRAIVGSRGNATKKSAVEDITQIAKTKQINQAKTAFEQRYQSIRKYVVAAFNRGEYGLAYDMLMALEDDKISALGEKLDASMKRLSQVRFVRASETKDPLAYNDHDLLACAFLPLGSSLKEGILNYTKDSSTILVRYEAGGKAIGCAICYLENGIFLVDSVEGNAWMRTEVFSRMVHNDLTRRARSKGAEMILFNTEVSNDTPKMFVSYLEKQALPKQKMRMEFWTKSYLEARDAQTEQREFGALAQMLQVLHPIVRAV